jgi:hypothetical protein
VIRLSIACGYLVVDRCSALTNWWWHTLDLEAYRQRSPEPRFGLQELEAALRELPGFPEDGVGWTWLTSNTVDSIWCDWEPAAIWPYFAERLHILEQLIRLGGKIPFAAWPGQPADLIRNACRVLRMFPVFPRVLLQPLWMQAFHESRQIREPLQELLSGDPQRAEQLAHALQNKQQAIRLAAADWLCRTPDPALIDSLKTAIRREKQAAVKSRLLQALETTGADIGEFLDLAELLKEASSGLARKRPAGSDWIPLDALPSLHWRDSGEPVDQRIVQWWVLQSVLARTIEPNPLTSRLLEHCRAADSHALGAWLLSAWIAEDTRTLTDTAARELARATADQQWRLYGQEDWFREEYPSAEHLYETLYRKALTIPVGSAMSQKGLLALVASLGSPQTGSLALQYVRKWGSQRTSQCKALIEMLSWMDEPTAAQALLELSSQTKTRAVQQAASLGVQRLAERRGWTAEELADRTIPTAGFIVRQQHAADALSGPPRLQLDYGGRQFIATLTDDLQVVLTRADGRPLKSLPAPAAGDDPDLVQQARQNLAAARKTVKGVIQQQSQRLQRSMLTQRNWSFAAWQELLQQHPIVGRLCPRIVWWAAPPTLPENSASAHLLFRPLTDHTLTNVNDEPVHIPADWQLRIAHTAVVTPEEESLWQQHLTDYRVAPLLPQFGRPRLTSAGLEELPPDHLDQLHGLQISTFRLRSVLTQLGWIRGPVDAGGQYSTWLKPLPELRSLIQLEFSGASIRGADHPIRLGSVTFLLAQPGQPTTPAPPTVPQRLATVPAVLLTETLVELEQLQLACS